MPKIPTKKPSVSKVAAQKVPHKSAAELPDAEPTPTILLTDAECRRAADLMAMGGDPARIKILAMVRDHAVFVGAISESMGMSQPAISHHLHGLRLAQLVEAQRDGKRNYYIATEAGRTLIDAAGAMVAGGVGR